MLMNLHFPRYTRWTFVLMLSIWMTVLTGQESFLGTSIVLDTLDKTYRASKNEFIFKYQNFIKSHVENIKSTYKGKAGKEMISEYRTSADELISQVRDNQYIFHPKIDTLVKNTLAKFKGTDVPNPEKILFLISKDLTLNAFCLSDGVLMINAGLFLWLYNNDQFASVLAHELGHYTLNHYNDYRYKFLQNEHSKNTKEELNQIKKTVTNQAKLAQNSLRQKLYNQARTQRKHELEADSIGYAYYTAAGFHPKEYLKSMELMLTYDTLPFFTLDTSIYYTLFDLPEQKINPAWLKGEDFDQYHYLNKPSEFHEDSLMSHPSMDVRIENLKKHYTLETDTTILFPDSTYANVTSIVASEIFPVFYYNEEYGVALYGILRRLQHDAENVYYRKWLGMLFNKIYEARKNYVLNRYVDAVDMRDKNRSYQQFLGFIWQLNLREIKVIADHYKDQKP